jgi:thioredoxin-like negative regulator of GroEL
MAPIVHGAEAEYAGQVKFVYLNIDDPAVDEYKEALPYRGQPTMVILSPEGEVLQTHYGYINEEQINALLDAALEG